MICSDFHMHTIFCDGKNTPEEMVVSAIEKGLTAIGFSGHSFLQLPEDDQWTMSSTEAEDYRCEIERLKEKYRGQIQIYCGIEQDYMSETPVKPFDYVIGSVHQISGPGFCFSVDNTPEIFTDGVNRYFGGDYYAACERYYETVADVVKKTGADIIGHFDLITKFNENDRLFNTRNNRYRTAALSAADVLLQSEAVFEINTGAISRGWRSEPYPSAEIIDYVNSKGGVFILSSDSHSAENIAFSFERYENRCLQYGIRLTEFVPKKEK